MGCGAFFHRHATPPEFRHGVNGGIAGDQDGFATRIGVLIPGHAHEKKIHQELHSNEMVKTMVGAGTALGALPASMVAQEIASKLLWPITLAGYTLRAEAIWMVRSPHRRDSQLMSRFEALIQTTQP